MVSYHHFLCGGPFRESERHTRSAGQIPCKLREPSIRRSAVRLNTDPARLRTLVSGTSSFPDPCAVSGWARRTKSASSFPIPGFPGDIVSAGRLLNRSISCVTCGMQPDIFKLPPMDEMVMYLNSSSVPGRRPPSSDDKRNFARCIPPTVVAPLSHVVCRSVLLNCKLYCDRKLARSMA